MAQPPSPFSSYQSLLRDFAYTYTYGFSPLLKAFSPTMYFGCNIQDAAVEEHVLGEVGSYGYQINRIMDALAVLMSRIDRAALTPAEARCVDRFYELAELADKAASEFRQKPRQGVTRADVDRVIDDILSLAAKDPSAYQELLDHTRKRLALSARPNSPGAD